jgi:hypothetical protein
MRMPMWLYLIALLSDQTAATCVALAEALQTVSHDRSTRPPRAHGSGATLQEPACHMGSSGSQVTSSSMTP